MSSVIYPYLPSGRNIEYVPQSNRFMAYARILAWYESEDLVMPGAAVIVKNNIILGAGANGSDFHAKDGCERVRQGCKTGEGYELCEGCHPKNHSEQRAIQSATENVSEFSWNDADLYLWGHWWCCKSCWDAMIRAQINRVFLLEYSYIMFNKEHPLNIVGKQFPVTLGPS